MSANINIASKNISVFPAVNRNIEQSNDIYSRHTSEEFLSGIINKLIDRDGFVITEKANFLSSSPFEFNIHGYYFSINQLSEIISQESVQALEEGAYLYAYVETEKHGVWTELAGSDTTLETGNDEEPNTYVYSSLTITSIEPTASTSLFYIPIMRKTGSWMVGDYNWNGTGWYVPEECYVKFDNTQERTSFLIGEVDGGDLDNLE